MDRYRLPLKRILSKSEFNAYDIDNKNIKSLKPKNPSWNLQNVDSLAHIFKDNFYYIVVGNPLFSKKISLYIPQKARFV